MPTVKDILGGNNTGAHVVFETTSVAEAITRMNQHRVGALLVTRPSGRVCGIITERDVLRRVVAREGRLTDVPVKEWMTRKVICCGMDTKLHEVQTLMMQHHIRHLPVIDGNRQPLAMLSIQDVNAFLAQDQEITLKYLAEYLYGPWE